MQAAEAATKEKKTKQGHFLLCSVDIVLHLTPVAHNFINSYMGPVISNQYYYQYYYPEIVDGRGERKPRWKFRACLRKLKPR